MSVFPLAQNTRLEGVAPIRIPARILLAGVIAACTVWLPALAVAADAAASPGDLQAPMMEQAPAVPVTELAPAVPSMEQAPAAPAMASAPKTKLANFAGAVPSVQARKLADWVVDSADNGRLPFMIVDKLQAQVFVFDAQGKLRGAAAALLGLATGDDSVPGIGQRKLSSIRPHERTTPAGRFVASLDRVLHGRELLWIDYDLALSLHPVVTTAAKERRAERLATPTPLDNRISFGCINVPARFYETVVQASFTGTNGIVYILPETRTSREVFGSYDVELSATAATRPAAP